MSRSYLVEELKQVGQLSDPNLAAAFSFVDRVDFVRPVDVTSAYLNEPLAIGFGQTISQPSTVALMLKWLEVSPGQNILEIGAGSGWQTALLSFLVSRDKTGRPLPASDRGQVTALELIPDLITFAGKNMARYKFISDKVVELHCLNASRGYLPKAPYDRIISAASGPDIPEAWKDQLKVGGIIVAPVGEDLVKLKKVSFGNFEESRQKGFLFVPFVSER